MHATKLSCMTHSLKCSDIQLMIDVFCMAFIAHSISSKVASKVKFAILEREGQIQLRTLDGFTLLTRG
jgi:hypothetical protein